MGRIIRRRKAENDLLDLWDYIEHASGVARADAYIHRLERALQALAAQPGLGRLRDELGENLHSLPVASHLIFYRPIEDGIEVVRIIHGNRDLDSAFREEANNQDDDSL